MDQKHQTLDAKTEARSTTSFARQPVMPLLKTRLVKASLRDLQREVPYQAPLIQPNGSILAGVLTAVVDSAGGCAAYTRMPANREVLSIDFKIISFSPALGQKINGTNCRRAGNNHEYGKTK